MKKLVLAPIAIVLLFASSWAWAGWPYSSGGGGGTSHNQSSAVDWIFGALTLTSPLPVASGGSGATTAPQALVNLGATIAPPAAPTVAVNTTAGNLTGPYYYRIAFITASGSTEVGTVSASVSPSAQQVNLTAIPTGPAGVTARGIYRTVTGGASPYVTYLVATISDNTTTTYTDNLADGSLGAAGLTLNSTGGRLYSQQKMGEANTDTTLFGYFALHINAGFYNSAFGNNALYSNTTGNNNNAFGYTALYSNATGSNNNAFGYSALYPNTTGSYNSAFGNYALQANTTGGSNNAFGNNDLHSNTTGGSNNAFGNNALYANTTSGNNSAFGDSAGRYISGGSVNNTTSSNSTYLGAQTYPLANGDTNETVIGYAAVGNGSNTVTLGSSIAGLYVNSNLILSQTAPTISSGFGSSPSIPNANGTVAFTVKVGSGGSATTGTIGMPAAAHGWVVDCSDITTPASFVTSQSGAGNTTSVPVANYSRTTGLAIAWTAGDVLACTASPY